MKYIAFILFLFFTLQAVYAQGKPPAPSIELNIQTEGGGAQDVVEFKLIPQGIQFCKEDDCDIEIYSSMTAYSVELPGEVICLKSGFGHRDCSEGNTIGRGDCGAGDTVDQAPLRMSYYKVEVYLNSTLKRYFFYDTRDDSFVSDCGDNSCTGNDFTVRYVVNLDKLEFYKQSTTSLIATPDKILSNGNVISWSYWKCDDPDFLPYWKINVVEENDHPKLLWGPYNDGISTTDYYKIYRAVTTSSTPPALGTFTLVETINDASTYSWIDEDWAYGGADYAHYYIKAGLLPSEGLSDASEVFTVNVSAYKRSGDNSFVISENTLRQNHPNPFNPTSIIEYSIKQDGYVSLTVYDIIGKEIIRLVDGMKYAGSYQVEFNAGELPSGIYFYELRAGTFVETKKMILTK